MSDFSCTLCANYDTVIYIYLYIYSVYIYIYKYVHLLIQAFPYLLSNMPNLRGWKIAEVHNQT